MNDDKGALLERPGVAGNDAKPETDPARLMARLAKLEGLLRDHQQALQSHRDMLLDELSRGGLDTPQKVEAACRAIPPAPTQASPRPDEPAPSTRRAQRPRIGRAV